MDSKIKAALLGDATAAAECTAAGIAIPCPFCGETKIVDDELDCYCDKCGAQASTLKLWNRRAPVQTENAEKDRDIVRLTAERDAAVADIMMAASGRCCQICSRDCVGYEEITTCTAFEYRGAQGEP